MGSVLIKYPMQSSKKFIARSSNSDSYLSTIHVAVLFGEELGYCDFSCISIILGFCPLKWSIWPLHLRGIIPKM